MQDMIFTKCILRMICQWNVHSCHCFLNIAIILFLRLVRIDMREIYHILAFHIKLFPQRDEHLFFSVPGVRDH